jgi:hypothetical protein
MAQPNVVTSLFGLNPELYQQNRMADLQAQQVRAGTMAASPGTMLNPSLAPLYAQAAQRGQLLGEAAKGVAGLLGVEDPELAKIREVQQMRQMFDVSNPAGLRQFAQALGQRGYSDLAIQASAKAADIDKDLAAAFKSRREATPAAEEQAKRIRLATLQDQLGDVEGAKQFDKEQQEGKVRVAAATVPAPGMVNVTDLKGAKSIVDDYTKAPRDKLKSVGEIGVLINQISTNPTALPQLQRSLVKLAGDSQIGQNEVKNILGSSGFPADVIDGVNKFLTGAPTNAKIQDVARGVKAIEQFYATQYEQGRETSKRVLANAKLDERTINDLIPKAYSTGTQAPIYAVNPQTKERIMSTDGGKTWTASK